MPARSFFGDIFQRPVRARPPYANLPFPFRRDYMGISRRAILKTSALGALASVAPVEAAPQQQQGRLPEAFDKLKPLGDRVKAISDDEFKARIANAQKLMTDSKPQF